MPSPFPGMNPYLEHPDIWPDFHLLCIAAIRNAIARLVSPNYIVRAEKSIYMKDDENVILALGRPDVSVATKSNLPPQSSGALAVAEAPAQYRIPKLQKRKSAFIEIRTGQGERVVTVIELLSPSNKTGRDGYAKKRRQALAGAANFVELDLLRGGPRMPIAHLQPCAYYALVSRPSDRPTVDVWAVGLRQPLPAIPIPLDPGVPEPILDLQTIVNRVYDDAVYDSSIYESEPVPALSPEDGEWAKGLVASMMPVAGNA